MGIRLLSDLRGLVGDIAEWTAKFAERGIGAALGRDSHYCVTSDASTSLRAALNAIGTKWWGKGDDAI